MKYVVIAIFCIVYVNRFWGGFEYLSILGLLYFVKLAEGEVRLMFVLGRVRLGLGRVRLVFE